MPLRVPRTRPDFFSSAKCAAPVLCRHPALRAALVRASLDPEIRAIARLAPTHAGTEKVDLDALVVTIGGRRLRLDVVPARRARSADEERELELAMMRLGLPPLVVTAEDLAAEPARSNRDLVWSHRGRVVQVDLRLQILGALGDDGPMTLDRLLTGLLVGREPVAAVMALACDDLVELDLETGPIGPSTTVRARTRA